MGIVVVCIVYIERQTREEESGIVLVGLVKVLTFQLANFLAVFSTKK